MRRKEGELATALREIQRIASSCLAAIDAKKESPARRNLVLRARSNAPDFSHPIRHFMNLHAKGMNGQQRFALVVAYLSKGRSETKVQLGAIKTAWNKMQRTLGKFNSGYAVWAKDSGWVDSPESKVYVVTRKWTEILSPNA